MENKICFTCLSQEEFLLLLQGTVAKALGDNLSQNTEEHGMLTRLEAAKFLKISLPTLSDWTKRRKLSAYRLGSRIYYKESELVEAVKKMRY